MKLVLFNRKRARVLNGRCRHLFEVQPAIEASKSAEP